MIPVPVLGAVIGNITGEFIYGICKNRFGQEEQRCAEEYRRQMQTLDRKLDDAALKSFTEIQTAFRRFSSIEKLSFDEDVNKAFSASILLARDVGVPEEKILKSRADIDRYFLD